MTLQQLLRYDYVWYFFFLNNFSEVERQLNNKPATTPQLPSKKQRNGSNSSIKHQHQTSDPTLSSSPRTFEANKSLDESQPMLSTFGGRSSQQPTPTSDLLTPGSQGLLSTKSTVVQLRRNTNKLGRQAPTPPKRTRYVRCKIRFQWEFFLVTRLARFPWYVLA